MAKRIRGKPLKYGLINLKFSSILKSAHKYGGRSNGGGKRYNR
jgi:hypothetical protein